jgi:ubiquinol-cytochrome c reductase cytochrome b subunit
VVERLLLWLDDRLRLSRFARSALNKVFPDNWSFMLGEIALYSLAVLILTGVYLTFFFHPSAREVVYEGSYRPLRGVRMSEAYESTVRLSFDVRAGLVFRQMHHWAALIFLGAIVAHLCRIFFTGAFRRPRELNWLVGVTLLLLAMLNGFSGYSLPDDLLSGTGLHIAYSILLAVPAAGTWLTFLVFGGEFPAPEIISRLFVLHVMLVPALIVGLVAAHLAILWRQKHTQFPGPGRHEDNVMGSWLWPTYAARSLGLFAFVVAVTAALGGLAQINPVWLYGPFEPSAVTTAAQPDWYMGWLEGALRLFPPWRVEVFGYGLSELFWPGVLLPGLTFALLYGWPFVERRLSGDGTEHHLLDRPRDRPLRTAAGVGMLTFYTVLFVAGSQDVIAEKLNVSIPPVTITFRVLVFVLPLISAVLAWRLCHDLQGAGRLESHAPTWPGPGDIAPARAAPSEEGRRTWRWRWAASAIAVIAACVSFLSRRRKRAVRVVRRARRT